MERTKLRTKKIRIPRVNISLLLNFDVSLSVNKKFSYGTYREKSHMEPNIQMRLTHSIFEAFSEVISLFKEMALLHII